MKKLFILLSLLGIMCEEQEEERKALPVVFFVLDAGDTLQKAYIETTYSVEDTIAVQGIRGAKVRLYFKGKVVNFKEEEEEWEKHPHIVYYANIDTNLLRPDIEYSLEVVMPWDDTVKAKTKIPGRFRILSPERFDTLSLKDSLPLIWSKSEGAYTMRVYAFVWDTTKQETLSLMDPRRLPIPAKGEDTILPLFSNAYSSYFSTADTFYMIRVEAMDENFFSYIFYTYLDSLNINLNKGYGVFGGHTYDSLIVFIKR